MKNLTLYKGFYFGTRNGERVGIHFTYNIDPISGEMINERETRIISQTQN